MVADRRPNLFIIGAMKSATTSLHAYLGRHPSIFMSDPKEPSYFVERRQLQAEYPSMEERGFWRSEDDYLRLFEGAKNATILGESSTAYTKLPRITNVPERIYEFNPKARFIYVVRDPVERTIGHYWHEARWFAEERGLVDAIREEPFYRDVSYYAMQLRAYFNIFGKERVKVVTFEELIANPIEVMHGLYKWLGQDCSFVPDKLGRRFHETPEVIYFVRGGGALHRFRYSRVWTKIGPRIPARVRVWGRTLAERKVHRKAVSYREVVDFLRPIQLEQTQELSRMLGREFPEWKTLQGKVRP